MSSFCLLSRLLPCNKLLRVSIQTLPLHSDKMYVQNKNLSNDFLENYFGNVCVLLYPLESNNNDIINQFKNQVQTIYL